MWRVRSGCGQSNLLARGGPDEVHTRTSTLYSSDTAAANTRRTERRDRCSEFFQC